MEKYKNGFLLIFLTSIIILVYALPVLLRDFWEPDETRYVSIIKHIYETKNFIRLEFADEVYLDKPPVYFWILFFFTYVFSSFSPLVLILPSILSAALILYLVYRFSKKNFDSDVATYSTLFLSLSPLFFIPSQMVRMDIFMSLIITYAMFLYLSFAKENRLNLLNVIAIFSLIALATLVKGIFGITLFLLVSSLYTILTKHIRTSKFIFYTLIGLVVYLLLVSIWGLLGYKYIGKKFFDEILVNQTYHRILTGKMHAEPFYYYLVFFVPVFFPWVLFVVYAIFFYAKKLVKGDISCTELFLILWVVAGLVLLSFSKGKLIVYLLPLAIPVAILLANLFKKLFDKPIIGYLLDATSILIFLFFLIGILYSLQISVFGGFRQLDFKFVVENIKLSQLLSILFFLLFTVLTILIKTPVNKLYGVAVNFTLVLTLLCITTLPELNKQKSMKYFAEIVKEKCKNKNIVSYDWAMGTALNIYLNKHIKPYNYNQLSEREQGEEKICVVTTLRNFEKRFKDRELRLNPVIYANKYVLFDF